MIPKQFRLPVILLAVLGALAGLAQWDEYQTKKDEEKERTEKLVFDFDSPAVSKIRFKSEDVVSDIVFEKEGSNWLIKEPVTTQADVAAVSNLLKTLDEYKYEKKLEKPKSAWKSYGLESPKRFIELSFADSDQTRTIFVGEKAAVGYSVYFRTSDSDTVYLGSQHLMTATAKSLRDLRDKTIAKIEASSVKEVEYYRGAKLVAHAKFPSNETIEAVYPEGMRLARTEFVDLMRDVVDARAESFKDNPDQKFLASFGRAKVVTRLVWTNADTSKGELELRKVGEDHYVKTGANTTYVKVSDTVASNLKRKLDDFRDKSLMQLEATKVAEVEIDGARYEKHEGDFYAAGSDGARGEKSDHIHELLVDISLAKVESYKLNTKEKKLLSNAPMSRVVIKMAGENNSEPVVFELWEGSDSEYLTKSPIDGQAVKVKRSVFTNIKKPEPVSDIDAAAADKAMKDNG